MDKSWGPISLLPKVSSWDCLRYVSTHVRSGPGQQLCGTETSESSLLYKDSLGQSSLLYKEQVAVPGEAANWAAEVSSCVAT